jgi:hypothetical protein
MRLQEKVKRGGYKQRLKEEVTRGGYKRRLQ